MEKKPDQLVLPLTIKINSPFIKYNGTQITCLLCNMKVPSESMWNLHCSSKKHKGLEQQHIEQSIQKQQQNKRKLDAELMPPPHTQYDTNNNNNTNKSGTPNKKIKIIESSNETIDNKNTVNNNNIININEEDYDMNEIFHDFEKDMEDIDEKHSDSDNDSSIDSETKRKMIQELKNETDLVINRSKSLIKEVVVDTTPSEDIINNDELIEKIDESEQRGLDDKFKQIEEIRMKTNSILNKKMSLISKNTNNNSSNNSIGNKDDLDLEEEDDDDNNYDFVYFANKK